MATIAFDFSLTLAWASTRRWRAAKALTRCNPAAPLPRERAHWKEYDDGHKVFRDVQRPIVVSVTAALDWPSGDRGETDCAQPKPPQPEGVSEAQKLEETRKIASEKDKARIREPESCARRGRVRLGDLRSVPGLQE